MATTIPNFNHQYLLSNLDTYNYTITAAGAHRVSVTISDVTTPSGISIVINQNGSQIATAGTAGSLLASVSVMSNFAVNDTLQIVVSSTTASDAGPNQIKGVINLKLGSS